MCCTGAHLLPKMGKLNTLPTTARAQSIPARASFFVESAFMRIPPIAKRSRLSGLLSRRNTASHRSSVVIIRCNIEITKLRALPLLFAASFSPRGIFTSFFVHSPTFIFDKIKNGAFHSKCEAPFNKSFSGDFLRRHYPHQVKKGRS